MTILYFYDNSFAHVRRRLAGVLHDSRMRLNGSRKDRNKFKVGR